MDYSIRENFQITLYGVPGVAVNREWGKTGMELMNTLWKEVKGRQLPNKGINVWVYEPGNAMYAGVELMAPPGEGSILERKELLLTKYIYYKHIGPYERRADSFQRLSEEFRQVGIQTGLPYLEIYGHWTEDASKLETELLWSLASTDSRS